MHLWEKAKAVCIQTGPEIVGGFSLGFERESQRKQRMP